MNNKRLKLLLAAAMTLFSSVALASGVHYTYGGTKAEAETSMLGWAAGRNVSYRCYQPSYGPPWMCEGRISNPTPKRTYHISYGTSESDARSAFIGYANGKDTSFSCRAGSYGPPWQCSGYIFG